MQYNTLDSKIREKYEPIATVFGSSSCLVNSLQYKFAENVGQILAKAGFTIASGGYSGIMDGVSKGAKKEITGRCIGITTNEINKVNASTYLTEEFREKSLMSRLDVLISIGNIYVFLPGSTGTLTELALVWDKHKLNLIRPIRPTFLFGKTWHTLFNMLFKNPDSNIQLSEWKKEKETAEFTILCNKMDNFEELIKKFELKN